MIICPGGGYEYQSDREGEPVALEFLKRGYQAFVLEYAVLEEQETQGLLPYPQMDLAKAVAYVKEHQELWNVDGEKITILGCSAGGNLCALYSGFYQQDWFEEKTGYSREQMQVHAMILCYPVIDLNAGWPKEDAVRERICREKRLGRRAGSGDGADAKDVYLAYEYGWNRTRRKYNILYAGSAASWGGRRVSYVSQRMSWAFACK